MVEATDGDGVLVTDLAAERARLGVANVMRFAGRSAAYNAGLGGEMSAVFLVAKTNRLRGDVAMANRVLRQNDRGRRRSLDPDASLGARRNDAIILGGIA